MEIGYSDFNLYFDGCWNFPRSDKLHDSGGTGSENTGQGGGSDSGTTGGGTGSGTDSGGDNEHITL